MMGVTDENGDNQSESNGNGWDISGGYPKKNLDKLGKNHNGRKGNYRIPKISMDCREIHHSSCHLVTSLPL